MTSTATRPPGPTPSEPSADGPPVPLSPTSLVAAGLAVPGLDLRTAHAVVDAHAGRRVRFRRGVLGGCATLVLVAGLVLAVDTDEPNDVIADGDEAPSSIVTSTTAAVAETVPVPAATVPATTVAPTSTVKAPVLTVPPTIATTTVPPNQPMSVTLNVVTPSVEAGQTAEVQVLWSDPDIADPLGVRTTSVWGDPAVTFPVSGEGRPPCQAPGLPGSGTIPLNFRYATPAPAPGRYTVSIQVSSCDGVGEYAEDRTLTAEITVSERAVDRVVVLKAPPGVPSLDAATFTLVPESGSPTTVSPLGGLGQVSTDSPPAPVTMVLVPTGFKGRIDVVAGGSCFSGQARGVSLSGTAIALDQACAAATAPVAP